jgi:hypothetical protein
VRHGEGLDLPHEPLGADHGGELRPEHLDGDLALVAQVVSEVDGGHPALPQLALDPIAPGEGGAEVIERSGRHAEPRADFARPGRSMVQLGAGGGCSGVRWIS